MFTAAAIRSRSSPSRPGPSSTDTKNPSPELRLLLSHLKIERGLAPNSLLAYQSDLHDLADYLKNLGCTFQTAAADDFRAYLRHQSSLGRSTKTVARRLAAIRILLKFIEQEFKVDKTLILAQLERPKPQHDLPKVLSRAQVAQLISAPNPKSRLFCRDVAILELLYASGLRASELTGLKRRDVNLQVGCVRVLGKGMKERIVPFGRAATEAITRYIETRPLPKIPADDHLFLSRSGRPMERIGLWMLVEKLARRAGLLKTVSPHVLRHCFATHLIGGGADLRVVQELLGHSDISTTQIYTHVDHQRLKAMHRKFHPRG